VRELIEQSVVLCENLLNSRLYCARTYGTVGCIVRELIEQSVVLCENLLNSRLYCARTYGTVCGIVPVNGLLS